MNPYGDSECHKHHSPTFWIDHQISNLSPTHLVSNTVTNIDVTDKVSSSKIQIGSSSKMQTGQNTNLSPFSQYVECDWRICPISSSISFSDFSHSVKNMIARITFCLIVFLFVDLASGIRRQRVSIPSKTLSKRIKSIKFRSKLYNYFYQGTISTDYIIASFIGSVTLWFEKRLKKQHWKPVLRFEKNDWSRHRIKTICGEIQQKTLIYLKFFKIFEACLAIYHQWVSIHLLGDGFFLIFMTNFHIERNHVKNKPNSRKSNGSYSVRSSKTLFLDKKRAWLNNMVESSKYLNWYLNV